MSRIFTLTSLLIAGLFFNTFAGSENPQEKKRLAHLAYDNLNIDSDLSLKYARKLELMAEHEQDTIYWSYALNLQGVIYNRYLSYSAALNVLEQANQLSPDSYNILFDLANTHRLAGKEETAIYYYQKALEADPSQEKLIWSHLGVLNLWNGKKEKAKEYFLKELNAATNLRDSITVCADLSYFYLQSKDYKEAKRYLDEAENKKEAFLKLNYSDKQFILAGLYSNFGQYYIEQRNTAEAEKFFTQALAIADRLRLGLVQEECYRGLQRVSVQKNDESMFQTYWQKQKDFTVDNSRQLSAYYEYYIYKKDRELQALKEKKKLPFGANAQMVIFGSLLLALALVFVAVFSFLLWKSNTKNKKLDVILYNRQQEINKLKAQKADLKTQLRAASDNKNS